MEFSQGKGFLIEPMGNDIISNRPEQFDELLAGQCSHE